MSVAQATQRSIGGRTSVSKIVEMNEEIGGAGDSGTTPLPSWKEILDAAVRALRNAGARFSQWVADHSEEIEEVLGGIAIMVTVQPRLQQLWERWGSDPEWAFLVSRLDFVNGLALMVLLDEGAEDDVIAFIESSLADPAFIERLRGEMEEAPLAAHHRKQLAAGLDHVAQQEYEVAVPLLIIALEGAFVEEAERRDLVERAKTKLRFTEASGKRGNVGSVEAILKPLGLDDALDGFMRRQVYGGRGDGFRHGTARDGWRPKALSLTIALCACLDLVSESEETLLIEAFSARAEGVEIAQRLVLATLPNLGAQAQASAAETLTGAEAA